MRETSRELPSKDKASNLPFRSEGGESPPGVCQSLCHQQNCAQTRCPYDSSQSPSIFCLFESRYLPKEAIHLFLF